MLRLFCSLILSFLSLVGFSQNDYSFFRNYKQDLVLVEEDANFEQYSFLLSGAFSSQYLTDNSYHYFFQGQEYISELALYFYPSRVYAPEDFRFNEPDPDSQYYSPYLFVGGDPVNYVDFTGNTGKPLILYGEDYDSPGNIDISSKEALAEMTDSYQLPLSDFINGKVGDLHEWNGNVFVLSHSGSDRHEEVEVARSKKLSNLKKVDGAMLDEGKDMSTQFVDAAHIGRKLRALAEERDVEVKNIVGGGCQGSFASRRIGVGFGELKKPNVVTAKNGTSRVVKRKLFTYGAKKGKYAYYVGKESGAEGKISGPEPAQMYLGGDEPMFFREETTASGERRIKNFYRVDPVSKAEVDYDYIQGGQLMDLANGRIPPSLMKDMTRGAVFY